MTIDTETSKQLVQAVLNATQLAADALCKLTALEKTLETYDPKLYQSYLKHLDQAQKSPPVSVSLAGFQGLHQRLAGLIGG